MRTRVSRRRFLRLGAAAAGMLMARWSLNPQAALAAMKELPGGSLPESVPVPGRGGALRKFVQRLRSVGSDIPLAQPDKANPGWWQPGVTHYTIIAGQFEDQLHPQLSNPTRLWGFGQGNPDAGPGWTRHLGGIIAAKRGAPVQITFRNSLPPQHIVPIDTTIMGADGAPNRITVHLHGGAVPWISDGGPHSWWDPNGGKGVSFLGNQVLRPGQSVPPTEGEYYYPNAQGARLLWYHDHAFGTTRINAYAGLATAYVLYDDYELSLVAGNNLPGPLDPRTVYLIFQDKIFVPPTVETTDPTWPTIMPHTRAGDLWYAHIYDPERWDLTEGKTPPQISAVPEFFADTILVNGTVYPYLELEPRQYRLRMLNVCNSRFLNPMLVHARGSAFPDNTEPDTSKPGPGFVQIGTEGGFLPAPVMVNGPKQPLLLLGPAERADLILDLRDVPAGTTLILYNDAPAPFPQGDDLNDYYPGNPKTPESAPGFGPNTRTLLQIVVKARSGVADPAITLPARLANPLDPFLVEQKPGIPTPAPAGVPVRRLTLSESADALGRLIQYLGTDQVVGQGAEHPLFGRAFMDTPTEVVPAGSTEVWEIVNVSADTHPIHFHLANVQVLSRQPFGEGYAGGAPAFSGDAVAPDANELGWKETVRMNPGQVTRVLIKFDLPAVPFTVPPSPRTGGAEYIWHCHILEHEEHDMMRPLVVT